MALLLWLIWGYLGGKGWPSSTSDARRHHLRANRRSARTYRWALIAGVLSVVALAGYWIALFRLVKMPPNALPDVSGYPPTTVALMIIMGSLVAPMMEEAGFRGYFQVALEREFRGAVAVTVSSLVFALAHFAHGIFWPKLLVYFFVGVAFGATAFLTNSTLPAVLYEMATGTLPFRGESSGVIFKTILDGTPTPAVRLNPDLPPKLEDIIDKCVEKDRNFRYQHASDIRTDLQRLRRDTESSRRLLPSSEILSSSSGVSTAERPAGGFGLVTAIKEHKLTSATGLIFAGLVVGAILYSKSRSENFSQVKVTHKQFTFVGNAFSPAISPDGLFVAYVKKKFGGQEKTVSAGIERLLSRNCSGQTPIQSAMVARRL